MFKLFVFSAILAITAAGTVAPYNTYSNVVTPDVHSTTYSGAVTPSAYSSNIYNGAGYSHIPGYNGAYNPQFYSAYNNLNGYNGFDGFNGFNAHNVYNGYPTTYSHYY